MKRSEFVGAGLALTTAWPITGWSVVLNDRNPGHPQFGPNRIALIRDTPTLPRGWFPRIVGVPDRVNGALTSTCRTDDASFESVAENARR
jgi:hypothetical protein